MIKLVRIAAVLLLFVSCEKQQTAEEKNAEIEREVQQRLEAQRQADEQQKLAARESELAAREKALAEQQMAAAQTPTPRPAATPEESEARPVATPEETETRSVAARIPASYDTFYTKLEPHGVWRETSTYGYVWQPRAAETSRNWRPYTNGRWVYTDAGWTWYSEEPFGWATYHYGRWTRLRNIGWVWVPGDEWAPAWVSWRKSDDYVGWAPLPPEATFDRRAGIQNWADNYYDIGPEQYAFVPTNEFGSRRIEHTVVPQERNVTIVNQTINVTNITYNNTTVVNQGPNYEDMRRRSRQPIDRLRLERRAQFEDEGTVVRGEVIAMPAPFIAPAQRHGRPARVKETIRETVVDHDSAAIGDRQAAEKARSKMRAEATPPSGLPPRKFVRPAAAAMTPATASPSPADTPDRRDQLRREAEKQRLSKEEEKERQKAAHTPPAMTPAPASPTATVPDRGKRSPSPSATIARPAGTPRSTPAMSPTQAPAQTPPAATPAAASPTATLPVRGKRGPSPSATIARPAGKPRSTPVVPPTQTPSPQTAVSPASPAGDTPVVSTPSKPTRVPPRPRRAQAPPKASPPAVPDTTPSPKISRPTPVGTPGISPAAIASPAASLSVSPKGKPQDDKRKEAEKKKAKKRDQTSPAPDAEVSPSPSPSP